MEQSDSVQMRDPENDDEWTSDNADVSPSERKFDVECVGECEYSGVIKLVNSLQLTQYAFNVYCRMHTVANGEYVPQTTK